MPFTASHIAAVLPAGRVPWLRDPLILSALVIGSMAPDAAHYVPFDVWWASGHSWSGLVVMDVPITLALVAVYWLLLAAPLRALAPRQIRARLPQDVLAGHRDMWPRTFGLLAVGAAIGAATHVIWDGFTHESGFGVLAIPLLQTPDVVGPLAAHRVLQHVCSVVGLALIAWSLLRWYERTPPSAVTPGLSWRWQLGSLVAVLTAGLFGWWSVRGLAAGADDLYGFRALLYGGLTRSIAGMTVVALVAASAARMWMLRPATPEVFDGAGRG